MHETTSWLSIAGVVVVIVATIVFTIMAIRNKNMKLGFTKEGPFVETKKDEAPPPAGGNNISGINIKARDVNGGIRIGHDNPGSK